MLVDTMITAVLLDNKRSMHVHVQVRGLTLFLAASVLLAGCSFGTAAGNLAPSPSASSEVNDSIQPTPIPLPTGLVRAGGLTFLSDTVYPPQESIDPATSKPIGFDIDVATALASRIGAPPGLRAEFKSLDFNLLLQRLNDGEGDAVISAMRITPERQQRAAFVGYFVAGQAIMVRKGNPLGIHGLSDLCGRKVAVQVQTNELDTLTASNADQCRSNKITIQVFPTDIEAFTRLQLGQVDAALDDSPVVAYFVQQKPDFFEIAGPILQNVLEGIAVDSRKPDLLKAIQQAMLAIYSDGTYRRLLIKWNLLDGEVPAAQIIVSPTSGAR